MSEAELIQWRIDQERLAAVQALSIQHGSHMPQEVAREIAPTLERVLRVNRGPASPVRGSSMDAVINALAEGMGRVEVSEAQAEEIDRAMDADKAQRWHQRNDAAALSAQVMDLDAMRRAGWL